MINRRFKLIEETHTYYWSGLSVSALVNALSPGEDNYDSVPEFVLKRAQQKGTCIHKQLELGIFECVCDVEVSSHIQKAISMKEVFDKYLKKLETDYGCSSTPSVLKEMSVVNEYLIGQIDAIVEINVDHMAIVDYKTTSAQHLDKWKIQLALYWWLAFGSTEKIFYCHFAIVWNDELIEIEISENEANDIIKRAIEYIELF